MATNEKALDLLEAAKAALAAAQSYVEQAAAATAGAASAAAGGGVDPTIFRLAIFVLAIFVGYYVV